MIGGGGGWREISPAGGASHEGLMVRTMEKHLSEHKAAVKKKDTKNGIAVHAYVNQHKVNWPGKLPQSSKKKETTGEEGS